MIGWSLRNFILTLISSMSACIDEHMRQKFCFRFLSKYKNVQGLKKSYWPYFTVVLPPLNVYTPNSVNQDVFPRLPIKFKNSKIHHCILYFASFDFEIVYDSKILRTKDWITWSTHQIGKLKRDETFALSLQWFACLCTWLQPNKRMTLRLNQDRVLSLQMLAIYKYLSIVHNWKLLIDQNTITSVSQDLLLRSIRFLHWRKSF